MAFKTITGQRKYYKYSECEEGQQLVDHGIYQGVEQGKFGIQHIFKQNDGEIVVLNSSGHLNFLMEKYAAVGSMCNVFYAEKVQLTKGTFAGKEAHNFKLQIDDEYSSAPVVKESDAPAKDDGKPDISL